MFKHHHNHGEDDDGHLEEEIKEENVDNKNENND